MTRTRDADVDGDAAALREAAADLRAARDRASDLEGDLASVADTYRDVAGIVDRNEERATDWDDFEGYVRFRETFGERVAEVPDDHPHRDAIEAADEHLTTGPTQVLSADDFAAAREALAPLREYAETRDALTDARERYREARRALRRRREDLRERVTDLERTLALGEADLDAPVDALREPIERYDERVREQFDSFRREAGAREVLAFVDATASYPLVEYRQPPDRLREFVEGNEAGEEPIPTLLEYADYSRSKLAHYVDDPGALQGAVATNRTYLTDLDASPLSVSWPPPPAERLRYRARELVAVAGRFADEETVAAARRVRDLAEREDYDRLRESAVARSELGADERERLERGAVERDLQEAREELERVESVLEEFPPVEEFGEGD